jgi:hypothetical protein
VVVVYANKKTRDVSTKQTNRVGSFDCFSVKTTSLGECKFEGKLEMIGIFVMLCGKWGKRIQVFVGCFGLLDSLNFLTTTVEFFECNGRMFAIIPNK